MTSKAHKISDMPRVSLIAFSFCLRTIAVAQTAAPVPPVAPIVEHREAHHGVTIVDNYFWLREKSNPEVIKYLDGENAYTDAITKELKPFEDSLYKEMLGRIKQTDLSVPTRRGAYLYYSRTEEGKQYPVQCRKKGGMDGAEEILLDMNEVAKGKKFAGLGAFVLSDDQNLLAYSVDYTGYRQFTLQVKDLTTGKILPDTLERTDSAVWAADNKTLFIVTEDAVTKRSDKLWRHVLGSKTFEPLAEEKDVLFDMGVGKSRDKKFIFLGSYSKDASEQSYLRADRPDDKFTVVAPREPMHRYYLDHRENLFYIRTNKYGHNFAVATAPDNDPSLKNWKPIVPHRDDVMIEDIDLYKDFGVVVEQSNALTNIRIYNFQTSQWSSIAFPEPIYSVFPGGTPDFDSKTIRYSYQSFVTPNSVFDYDAASGKSTLLKQQDVLGGYDPKQYVSERQWAIARDGTKVPISLVYKKGFEKNGKGPMLLYAYGSYGAGTPVSFSSSRLSMLDRGVAYAIAHIRGGNEMGEQWREDGRMMKKKNTFTDFVDCAKYLIGEKWTSPSRLMIEGASAGGMLMGAVVNMNPELFRAVHLGVPFVDVLNDMLDASQPLTSGEWIEWGNPIKDKDAFDYMKSYSPYDNLEKRDYPSMLLTESLNDSQVMYWEAAKYTARLRTLKTDHNPLLLKMKMDPAGHGGASGRYDRLHDQAFEYAWMLSQVGITK
jgi:oligopeptidase B